MTPGGAFDRLLSDLLGSPNPARIGVAVSGGSDSTALLHLTVEWAATTGIHVHAATVDHRLRDESADEATGVAALCETMKIPHKILKWQGWDGVGNLQDQARQARYRLLADWAKATGLTHVLLGHTQDDQAETVILRLARGSGVDGISAIPRRRSTDNVVWLRPILDLSRDDLRQYLREKGIGWIEDPSNDDRRYDRIKVRSALDVLENLGVTRQGLADTAARMTSARQVLERATQDAARKIAAVRGGSVELRLESFFLLPDDTRRRLLNHALCWVASEHYSPRNSALIGLEQNIRQGKTATLQGCLIAAGNAKITIDREFAAVARKMTQPDEIWDNRWVLTGPDHAEFTIRATGEAGLLLCPDWRSTGHSRTGLIAAPAVWKSDALVAAPLAGLPNGWHAELIHNENHFYTSIISH